MFSGAAAVVELDAIVVVVDSLAVSAAVDSLELMTRPGEEEGDGVAVVAAEAEAVSNGMDILLPLTSDDFLS